MTMLRAKFIEEDRTLAENNLGIHRLLADPAKPLGHRIIRLGGCGSLGRLH
jgi:hypothetical protein